MGGQVLELFSEQIERETTERVTAQVTQQVTQQVTEHFCTLIQRLLAEGRHEDIARATSDRDCLEKLYTEFQL
ncbi:MAG: hypothetical protein J6K04_13330 [Lachnospiraceae bacterium]|nr:hypothetical protein [Lachnospiraceae bacterium]